ncbi:hypothetical protein DSECCO2_573560 [anaerobic digester metagenome]
MMHTDFGGDALLFKRHSGVEKFKFLCGRHMKNMQTGFLFPRQRHSVRRCFEAGFGTADGRMHRCTDFVAEKVFKRFRIPFDRLFVFAMCSYDMRRFGKKLFNGLCIVDQKISGGRTQKYFYSANRIQWRFQHFFDVVVRHAHVETVIGERILRSDFIFGFEQILCERGRFGIWHFHVRRHTTGNSRTAFGVNGCLFFHARLAEMHLVVDDTGQEIFPFGIDGRIARGGFRIFSFVDFLDQTAGNKNLALKAPAFVYDPGVKDVIGFHYCFL